MIDDIEKLMKGLPPVKGKSAGAACLIGFMFGGLGLAIYFRNVVDAFLPVGVAIVASVYVGVDIGLLAGGIVAALYGYRRVQLSEQMAH